MKSFILIATILHIIFFLIQVGGVGVQVHLYHKNTDHYLRYLDKKFLVARRVNVVLIVWATFFMAWSVWWVLYFLHVV